MKTSSMETERLHTRTIEVKHYKYWGLRVASEIPIPEWSAFEDSPDTTEDVSISQSTVHPESLKRRQSDSLAVTQVSCDYCEFRVQRVGIFQISNGNEIIILPEEGAGQRELRNWLIGSAWAALCYQRGLFLIHASAIVTDGEAVLFCAQSKGGKSTIAAQLENCGYSLLSDDLCHLAVPETGSPAVYASSPRLKLWADAVDKFGLDARELEPDVVRRGKFHSLRPSPPLAQSVPVRGIYLLEWGEFQIQRLSGLAALRRLVAAGTYRPKLLHSMGLQSSHLAQSLALVTRVPVWNLSRPRDLSELGHTACLITEHWASHRIIGM